jgi:hypothetical protein
MRNRALAHQLLVAMIVGTLAQSVVRGQEAGGAATPHNLSADLGHLDTFVHTAAKEAHDARRATLITTGAAGAALVPAGIAIAQRPDDVSRSIGIGMTFGGAIPLAFAALSLSPSPMERLAARFDALRESGLPPLDLERMTTNEWRQLARISGERRRSGGARRMVVGLAATAIGLAFLRERPIGNLSQSSQYTIGSVLVGTGAPMLQLGIRMRTQLSPQETWWNAYTKERP